MSRRDARLYLGEMIEACEKVAAYILDMDEDRFRASTLVQDAVLRNLEILGEAARQLPDELRERYTDVPWSRIIGFRNIAIHAYFAVDLSTVWRIAALNIPELSPQFHRMLDDLGGLPTVERAH